MSDHKVGRNDPCPCGSGRKYKRCCLHAARQSHEPPTVAEARAERPAEAESPRSPAMPRIVDELQTAQDGHEFESLEEVQRFVESFMHKRNESGLDDFDGLSPHQMNDFLTMPFESPALIEFSKELDHEPSAPLTELFRCVIEAIDDKGLKVTKKGNLPRALCREAAQRVKGPEGYAEFTAYMTINSEEDYRDLFVARNAAQLAGFLRKQHGRLYRTKRCDELMESGSLARIYPRLFAAVATKFNWGWGDRCPELPIVQRAFAFTLRLLHRYGAEWKDARFYEDAFVSAYPNALAECADSPHFPAVKLLPLCYRIRTLEHFAVYCGLAEMEVVSGSKRFIDDCRVRGLPLLESVVRFRV